MDTTYQDEKFYIHGRPAEITPSGKWLGTKDVKKEDLPAAVLKTFEEILEEATGHQEDPEEGEDDLEVTYAQVDEGNPDVWQLGIHWPSPFNPSGFDFYVRTDGSYIGYVES